MSIHSSKSMQTTVTPYEIVSFDLQGTISDAAFSDEFWLEILPRLYAEKYCVSLDESKQILKTHFKEVGRYDIRYYSYDYWLKKFEIDLSWDELLTHFNKNALVFPEMQTLILKLHKRCPLLLFSATTRQFIDHELGELKSAFRWVISALDDLKCAGKPKEAFVDIAKSLNVQPNKILHIGDDTLMDVENARLAGWNSFHLTRTNFKQLCDTLAIS